jgi:cytoskeleton protein RodZ
MNARPAGSSPGALLRAAREVRGLSIEEVADRLRLNAALVLAMEQDRLALLGAPVFARGHLRNYAALVGAPEKEVMAACDPDEVPGPTFLPALDRHRVTKSRPRWVWPVVAATLAVAIAAALWWWMSQA